MFDSPRYLQYKLRVSVLIVYSGRAQRGIGWELAWLKAKYWDCGKKQDPRSQCLGSAREKDDSEWGPGNWESFTSDHSPASRIIAGSSLTGLKRHKKHSSRRERCDGMRCWGSRICYYLAWRLEVFGVDNQNQHQTSSTPVCYENQICRFGQQQKAVCSKYWISRNLFRLTGRWEKGKNSGGQTVIGKSSDRDIKTCLHKPRPLPRYNLHSRHCIPVWPELPGPGLPSSSRRYVLIVWYANVKIQTQRERDWLVFSHGSLRSLIEVSANIILELSASQEIRQLAAWARHPRFTIEVKFWLKGRTEDCVRDRNNKSSVLWGCKNYCEINQPLRDYSGNNKEQELGMINEYRDCNQYFFIFKWTQWVPRAEETTEDIYVHVSKWTMSGPGYWDSPEGIITTLNTQTLGDHPAPRHTAQWL